MVLLAEQLVSAPVKLDANVTQEITVIFGRKKYSEPESADSPDDVDVTTVDDAEAIDADDIDDTDEWVALDAQDWRADGPFDISEVDLEADDVVRLDLGSVVLTPFEGMQLQLQVDEATQQVNAVLATKDDSGIEVALFAAPRSSSMLAEIRADMLNETQQAGGTATLAKGPFGTEIRRMLPVPGPNGEQLLHVSRTWFAQGPRWLLRGVVVGRAGQHPDLDGVALELYEFFANAVVRRGDQPLGAGDLIPMTLPEGIAPQ